MSLNSDATDNITTTATPDIPKHNFQNELKYLIVPLVVILVVMLLSALVYLMVKKRRFQKLRDNILSLYEFDSNEQEWEPLNSYDNPNYTTYTTTSF